MVSVALPKPGPEPAMKPLLCPTCRRHLGFTTAAAGETVKIKCTGCRGKPWVKAIFGNGVR
jgi:ribosomal protein L33